MDKGQRLIDKNNPEKPSSKELRVTRGQLLDAIQGFFWQDMKSELQEIKDNALERMALEKDGDELRRYQGRIQALNMCLNLPFVMLEELDIQAKERSNK